MGLFGGGNSSKSSTVNNDNRALNAAGNTGNAIMGTGNTITTTDFGAITGALEAASESMRNAYDFSSGVTDRAFDSIDSNSAEAFSFANQAMESALDESAAARGEAFSAISESNKRVDEFYKSSGRETAADSMNIIKIMAALVAAGLLVGMVKRA